MGVGGQRHASAALPPGRTRYPLYRRLRVVPSVGLDGCGKSRPPPGFDPRTLQPVASCYTSWGIPARSVGTDGCFLQVKVVGTWDGAFFSGADFGRMGRFTPLLVLNDFTAGTGISWHLLFSKNAGPCAPILIRVCVVFVTHSIMIPTQHKNNLIGFAASSRPLTCWDRGFESHRGHGFVCCECRVLSGRGLCDELITRPEESYRLWCVVCDLETSRMGAPYIYDISRLRVNNQIAFWVFLLKIFVL